MIDCRKLGDRVIARGRVGELDPKNRHGNAALDLADRQRQSVTAHRRRETGQQDIASRRQQRRAGTVGAITVRQRSARVGGVGG